MAARRRAALAFCATLTAHPAAASCAADAMLVFDASASMTAQAFNASSTQRIHEARAAVADVLPRVEDTRRIGLIVYGPGSPDTCAGIDQRFPPLARAATRVTAEIAGTSPGGLTPLTAATEQAAQALDYRLRPGVIVVVTDGNESCGGAPCVLADRLAAEAHDLTVHVLGFKVVWDTFASHGERQAPYYGAEVLARCLADRTGGTYASTQTVDELVAALNRTLGCPVVGRLE